MGKATQMRLYVSLIAPQPSLTMYRKAKEEGRKGETIKEQKGRTPLINLFIPFFSNFVDNWDL